MKEKKDPYSILEHEIRYPFQKDPSFKLTDWNDGFCRQGPPLVSFLTNRYRRPHGGIYSTPRSTAIGHASCYSEAPTIPHFTVDVNLNVSCIAQSQADKFLLDAK